MTVPQSDLSETAMSDIHPIKSKPQQQTSPTHPPSHPAKQDSTANPLHNVVKSVVDDIVDNVALTQEKQKVQSLINDLVTKVRHDATAAAAAANAEAPSRLTEHGEQSSTVMNPHALEAKPVVVGVPYGDHRLRRVKSRPVLWMQTMDSITVSVIIPAWVRKQHVSVVFTSGSLKALVARDAQTVVKVDEPLVAEIDVDGCTWAVEDNGGRRQLTLELEKAKEKWWSKLFMADDPADYIIVEAGSAEDDNTITDLPCDDNGNEISGSVEANGVRDANTERQETEGTDGDSKIETTVDQSKEEVDSEQSEGSLGDVVSAAVDDVVDAVAAEKEFGSLNRADRGARSSIGKKPEAAPQKILTRADLAAMVEQYKEAFKKGGQGSSSAAMQLATFYHHGIGVEQNDAQAARLYKYALEHGKPDASAAFQLGLIYNQGAPGLEPDATEAVRWWKVSAGMGYPVAMFNLGVMAMNGSGCDMDPVLATQWFQKAQALNPQLRPPQFSQAQMEERLMTAARLKKQRMKEMMPPEVKRQRREEALRKAKMAGYTTVGVVGLVVSIVAIRHWMHNRL